MVTTQAYPKLPKFSEHLCKMIEFRFPIYKASEIIRETSEVFFELAEQLHLQNRKCAIFSW